MTSAIRPEYAALASEFVALASHFEHDVDSVLRRDIARLASTMECIDRHVDDVADDGARRALWSAIVDLLATAGTPTSTTLAPELARSVLDVREVALRRRVLPRMLRVVRKEIATSETMRRTTHRGEYVDAVLREGRLTAALALIVAGPSCGRPFRRFFFRLGGPANLVDKLLDAPADHARGEMRLSPGLRLRGRLVASIALRLPSLFASHPRWWRVIGLGARYLVASPAALSTAR